MKNQLPPRNILIVFFIVCCELMYSQSGKYSFVGMVFDNMSGNGVDSVRLSTIDSSHVFYTNKYGRVRCRVPNNYSEIVVYRESYRTDTIKGESGIHSIPLIPLIVDSAKLFYLKNAFRAYPFQIPFGSVMLSYERMISRKLSLLLISRYYYNGRNIFGSETYKGYEIAPSIRFYYKQNPRTAYYLQAQAIIASFDFPKLNYRYMNYYTYSVSEDFDSFGGSFGFGFSHKIIGFSRLIIDLNINLKILPHNYPLTVKDEYGVEYEHNPAWWYLIGPGTIFEANFSIGGMW